MLKPQKEYLPPHLIPNIQNTKPEVFIIESLDSDDEKHKRYEGLLLSDMLRLANKSPKYHYINSIDELPLVIGLFRQSQYRYLHISCHANSSEIAIGNSSMPYKEFASCFKGHLNLRRVFLSACKTGNSELFNELEKANQGLHSIVAPIKSISFDNAAAIWSALYLSLFEEKTTSMKHSGIEKRLKNLSQLFPVDFYWAKFNSKNNAWENKVIENQF